MNPPTKRHKGVACVHCRQMKLRCDSGDRFPAPCSRCHRAGRDCSINPSFKRTAKRDRLDELEREIHILRNNLWDSSTGVGGGIKNPSDTSSIPDNIDDLQEDAHAPSSTTGPGTASSAIPDVQTLEQIAVSRGLFMRILDEYYRYYHPRFQFLPPKEKVLQDCGSCLLLFWAMVAVSSRSVPECKEFRKSLNWPLRRLAMDSAIRETPSLPLVQAYLLLCVWAMPFGAVSDDPSWTYCGVATHKAQHLGLHRPNHFNEFIVGAGFDHELHASMRQTWLACFILNQNISSKLGVPATIRPDYTIVQALNADDYGNPTFRQLLNLAHQEATFSNLLGQNVSTADGLTSDPLPVIQAADLELELFEMRHKATWSSDVERCFLGVKLRLYSYALLRSERPGDGKTEDRSKSSGLKAFSSRTSVASYLSKSYTAALRLISISCQDKTTDYRSSDDLHMLEPSASNNIWHLWTSADVANVILAAFVLLQLTRRLNSREDDDTEAENAISRAWYILSSLSISKGDHYNRVCDIIEYISKFKWPSRSDPTLLVRSRMGASIQMDLIHRARRRFVGGVSTYSRQLPETDAEMSMNSNNNINLDGMIEFSGMPDGICTSFDDILWPMWDPSLRSNHLS